MITAHWYDSPRKTQNGFTLLEVLVAVSILAITAVTLLASQRQNLASFEALSSELLLGQLAAQKLHEQSTHQQSVMPGKGGFGPHYPGYRWVLRKRSLVREGTTELDTLGSYLSMVEITVFAPDEITQFSLQQIICNDAALE